MPPEIAPAVPPVSTPPPAESAPPPADPVKEGALASILGLVKPEEAVVPPPPPRRSVTSYGDDDDDDSVPAAKTTVPAPEPPKVEPAKAAPDKVDPPKTEPPKVEPAPAAPPATQPKAETPKKVAVRAKPSLTEEVRQAIKETLTLAKVEAKPAPAPVSASEELDLTPEEREELELAKFAETKDPAKYKGVADKFRTFYKAQKTFLEQKLEQAAKNGEEYDPAQDPAYKRFLVANEPKLPPTERKALFREKIVEEARVQVESKIAPEQERLRRELIEVKQAPAIRQQVNQFVAETAQAMPEDVVKWHVENGSDVNKTRTQFPHEFEVIESFVTGAASLAEEFLYLRSGARVFDPNSNGKHKFLATFIGEQSQAFQRHGGKALVRDGKTFVPPSEFTPDKAATHWTFGDADVLRMLRVRAAQDARARIADEKKRIAALGYAQVPRAAAPASADPAPKAGAPAKVPEASPRIPADALPGAGTAAPAVESNPLLKALNL